MPPKSRDFPGSGECRRKSRKMEGRAEPGSLSLTSSLGKSLREGWGHLAGLGLPCGVTAESLEGRWTGAR